jgi:hypothetical protein
LQSFKISWQIYALTRPTTFFVELFEKYALKHVRRFGTDENWVFKLNGKDYKFNKERKTNKENQSEFPRQQEPQQRETQQTHQITYHSDQLFQQPQHCETLHQASFMPYTMLGDKTFYNMQHAPQTLNDCGIMDYDEETQ